MAVILPPKLKQLMRREPTSHATVLKPGLTHDALRFATPGASRDYQLPSAQIKQLQEMRTCCSCRRA